MTNRFDVHYQSGATNRDSGERGTFPKSGGSLPFAPPPSLSEKSNTTSVQHIYQTAVTKVAGDRVVLNNLRSERIRCVNNSFVLVDFPSPSTSVPLCYSFIHSSRSFFSSFSSHSLLIILLCFLAYRAVLFSFFPPLFRVPRILFLLLLLLFLLLLLLLHVDGGNSVSYARRLVETVSLACRYCYGSARASSGVRSLYFSRVVGWLDVSRSVVVFVPAVVRWRWDTRSVWNDGACLRAWCCLIHELGMSKI